MRFLFLELHVGMWVSRYVNSGDVGMNYMESWGESKGALRILQSSGVKWAWEAESKGF